MPPLRLSDDELDAVMLAARPLRPHDRDSFLQEVATALAGCSEIGPGTVAKACRAAQRKFFDPPALARRQQISLSITAAPVVKTLANQRAPRFRTIQVCRHDGIRTSA